jgi:hypothetical protein
MEIEARRAARLALASAAGSLVAAITLTAVSQGSFGVAKAASASSVEQEQEQEQMVAMMENRRVISYPFEQVWPTAIRYLRVDRGFTVTDRDVEAGYVLFEFPIDNDKRGNGSLEMFRTEDSSGRPSVSVSISTGAGPVHLPNALLDGLAAKVREERGQPAPPPPKDSPKPVEPPKDGGDDEDPDDGSVPLLPPASDPP